MRISPLGNYYTNRNRTPQFEGTVSPKFVDYVNALGNECLVGVAENRLQSVSKSVNKICADIIAKTQRVMETCFPPATELSIDTAKNEVSDFITMYNSGIAKYIDNYEADNEVFIPKENKEEMVTPIKKLLLLNEFIKSGFVFGEAFAKEILTIKAANFLLKRCGEYKGNGEKFDAVLNLCNWWQGHIGLLKNEETAIEHDYTRYGDLLNNLTSKITEHKQYLQENTISYALRDGKLNTVTDNLFGHLYEMLGMPSDDVIYDGRMTEYEMKRFLDELIPPVVRKKNQLSDAELDNLLNWHIQPIIGTENSFRGPAGYRDIKQLKPYNLEFVNAEYIYDLVFDMTDTDELVEFIKTMQKDNIYIGCPFGMKQTDYVLAVNQYFNPMSKDTYDYSVNSYSTWDTFEDLCDALTPEQKKEMGWTEEFETKLRQKIKANREWLYENW